MEPGDSLVITGPSGAATHPVAQASRLWAPRDGTMLRPAAGDGDAMFCPRVSLPAASETSRAVLSRPNRECTIDDANALAALDDVAPWASGGRQTDHQDWSIALPGEQQRVAFAGFAEAEGDLDESTSAIDEGQEYAIHRQPNPPADSIIVSIHPPQDRRTAPRNITRGAVQRTADGSWSGRTVSRWGLANDDAGQIPEEAGQSG